jgi:uncharacterized protein
MSSSATSTLAVRVRPGAPRDDLQRDGAGWKALVSAPPVDGEANLRLCQFLAKEVFGLSRSGVRVRLGATGRSKVVEVDLEPAAMAAALSRWEARRG